MIVSTGIIATLSGDEDADYLLISCLGDAVRAAAESVAAGVPGCQGGGTYTFHYLGDESVNAERCSACGRWASNLNKSDMIDGIQAGDSLAGRFVCIPCQTTERERRAWHKSPE